MRIAAGLGSDVTGVGSDPRDVVEEVAAAEAAGFPSAWTVHFTRGYDALAVLGVAGAQARRIDLGVGVVPSYPRHPAALAQQAATTQALIGGRLTLGVGVSHRPVIEGALGLAYERPAAHMREYLAVLTALLRTGTVSFTGRHYRVEVAIAVDPRRPVAVVVGALGGAMVQAAGELADGVVTWLAGRRTLGEDIGPSLRAAAEQAGRPGPRLVAALPVAVTGDPDGARAAAGTVFGRYAGLENYQRLFAREGVAGPADLAVIGDEDTVVAALARLADLGVTELWPIPYPVGDDATESRTRALLRDLAAR